jgi:hypothetical protein
MMLCNISFLIGNLIEEALKLQLCVVRRKSSL